MSLYHDERPQSFKDLVGQKAAVTALKRAFADVSKAPHCILLTGGSGTGKTTTARLLQKRLNCHKSCYNELNCADARGIEDIRRIRSQMTRKPMGGDCHIWVIDECHQLTKDAQNAALKMFEDTPKHVYFILCTTDPHKLLKTIKTRCTEFRFQNVRVADLRALAEKTATKYEKEVDEAVLDKLAELAAGSPRKALVLLEQVWNSDDVDEQLAILGNMEEDAFTLARALISPGCKWGDVKSLLEALQKKEENPEGLRRMILGYCSSVMIGGKGMAGRAYAIANVFSEHFYDTGFPGLVRACWEVCHDMD